MNNILFITGIFMVLFTNEIIAQRSHSELHESNEKRENKREIKKRQRAAALNEIANLARTKQWAIQADIITIPYYGSYQFNPNSRLNFLMLDDDHLVVQIVLDEFDNSDDWIVRIWRDCSWSAKIENYEVDLSKKSVNISMKRGAGYGPPQYYLYINSTGRAKAIIGINNTLHLSGEFIPLNQADIYLRELKKEY